MNSLLTHDALLTDDNIQAALTYFSMLHKPKYDKGVTPPLEERVAVAALEEMIKKKGNAV